MVNNWDEKGRPTPRLTNSNFPEWSQVVGGIMEAAGYSSPLEALSVPLDEEQKTMRALVGVMKHKEQYAPKQMIAMCQEKGLFLTLVGERTGFSTLQPWQLAKFGKLLTSYDDCMIGTARFRCEGEYHAKRYWVIKENGGKDAEKRPQTRMPKGDARSARSMQGRKTTLQAQKSGYVN
jgi:hypothetical protein